ncbi:MAG: Ig-like domain-containing protein [Acidimicrobiia bacterium]
MTVDQSTERQDRWGWSSRLTRLSRALGMITLAFLLTRCGSSSGPQEQAVQTPRPEPSQAAAPSEQTTLDPTSAPTVLRGHIIPNLPTASSTLSVDLRAVDPMGKPVTFRYQWLVDGYAIAGGTRAQLPPGEFVRDQRVSVEVIPIAGGQEGPVWRASPVEIGNSAPQVRRVQIQPSPATRREPLRVSADVVDPDGDPVTVSYQWLRNGTPISGATGATLDPSHYRWKDWISVEIVATDGADSTRPLRSHAVDVLPAAPKFVSRVAPTDWKDGRFRYQAQAVHPDGNPLYYTLSEDAPRGMRINAESGLVEWEPRPSQSGSFAFQVIVEDADGATVAQPITLTIGTQKQ